MPRGPEALLLALVVSAAALVPPAIAVMPPWVYKEARDKAMFHVQVKVLGVTKADPMPGACGVTAEVVRIFRDRVGALHPGDRIDFAVSCARGGDTAPGGPLWTDVARLQRARFMEVFLNREGGLYEVALWQSRILDRPTREPAF